ncbi:MAG: NAD-dependent epimerase/dehydratase family protein [Dehalococcoidia bacterium]|nr:NAD-dependent epimerase/dehydratase family protein [Dehalococcoidia bacterium]MSQ34829.1 NAD-dependent epimerase/dehydratase family protein [Dehalococcoidia bacterium]
MVDETRPGNTLAPSAQDGRPLPRRIAITGSAGFLGQAALRRLAALPSTELIAAIDLLPSVHGNGTQRVVSVMRDVREPLGDVLAGYGIEAVIHLAYLLKSSRDGAFAWQVNVGATESLLKACAAAGVRQVIYLSSTTTYGAHKGFVRPFGETTPVNPVKGFQYSEQKVAAEKLLFRFSEENPGCAVSVLRGCVVMAAGADNFIAQALGRRLLPAPLGFNPEMQFLHVDDYVSAVEAALASRARGVYNIAGDGTVRWRDVAKASGARLLPVPGPLLTGAVNMTWRARLQSQSPACGLDFIKHPWLASTDKAKAELGWRPLYSSRQALQAWVDGRKVNAPRSVC